MKTEKSYPINVYFVFVQCRNCDLKQEIFINHGKKIHETICPHCKCGSLILSNRTTKYMQ